MTVNELRIGNWLIDYENKIGKVKSIEDYNVLKVVSNEGVLISYCEIELYKPIPLTEEILLNCGFKISSYPETIFYSIIFDDVALYTLTINRKLGTNVFTYKNENSITQIKHLHQLQNLYFSLTNQELNIEL